MSRFPVAEIFTSINGEGVLAGQPAVFVRFTGCNLKCSFCDTMWANMPDAKHTIMTDDEIIDYILRTGIYNVTLTGGEPLLQKDLPELLSKISAHPQLKAEIETNGSMDISQVLKIPNVTVTMDCKMPVSGMYDRMRHENFALLTKNDTVKFVVGDMNDLLTAKSIIDKYSLINKCHVYFSPVFGAIPPAQIVDFMIENKLNNVNLQLQMHKYIWSPNARGV